MGDRDNPRQSDGIAVLLIAHGSRRAEANAELAEIANLVIERAEYAIVEPSYLEIAEPTIPQAAAKCVDRGATSVLMLPYFLSAGSHVVDDLERHRRELSEMHPDVTWRMCTPLGLHPLMTEIVFDRLREGAASVQASRGR